MKDQKSTIEQLDRYVRANFPVITLISHEEQRVMGAIQALARKRGRAVANWSLTTGLVGLDAISAEDTQDPIAVLEQIAAFVTRPNEQKVIFVLRDYHQLVDSPLTVRYLRDLAGSMAYHTLILLSPTFTVPSDLEKAVTVIDWPLPDVEELGRILSGVERGLPASVPVHLNGNRETVIRSLQGLTAFEAESVILAATAATGELSEAIIPHIVREKAQIIRKSGLLEFYDTSLTSADVGGLDGLKRYAGIKLSTFSDKARQAGVDPAKGVLLVGIPGTGKSLTAKAIAGGRMPLLRMDVGALFGGLVGQSESNMRGALKVAEAVAPCVIWLDEIEKALGGTGGEMDGGTTQRVFGTLLTWMQETTAPVYIVATANDVRSLKPELLRRFDDIFFVDLPDTLARAEILDVQLKKRGSGLHNFTGDEVGRIVMALWGYTGAEIEKVVKAAIEEAFYTESELQASHLVEAAGQIIPISTTMQAQIEDLRAWAKNRAREAGRPLEGREVATTARTIEI